ncbi:hypothetical protein [Paenibacillus sp. FSL H7-0331]|uniref:IS66 family insertion sequence element accessory protein TnpA n=1 Tax=Paenibacillus sp. FSL H7-0331 TaxID=1920421 RepID=UPI00096EAEF0|nr:hypothetical protein [Paenibacillus sp. FSL H7-0331]OMF08810.1 hypothetical protein BK127_28140 [Paenibacillus sp. FSL H7-0331]
MKRIRSYQASDQTMKAWCMEHDVAVHQFKFWLPTPEEPHKARAKESRPVLDAYNAWLRQQKSRHIEQ